MKTNTLRKNRLVLLMIVVFATFTAIPSLAFEGVVKIGVHLPITGALSVYSDRNIRGVKMAAEDINAAGGILGKKVEYVVEDNAASTSQSAALVKKLAANKEIIALLGPGSTTCNVAIQPVLEECKTLCICPMSQGGMEFSRWAFRSTWTTSLWLPQLVEFLHKKWNFKTAAIIYAINEDYSKNEREWFIKACKENGIELIADEGYRTNDTDFSAQLTKFKAANPDVLFFSMWIKEGSLVMIGARRLGINAKFLGGSGLADSKRWYEASGGKSDGVVSATPFWYKSQRLMVKNFVERYMKEYKEIPPMHVAFAYDAMFLIADAAKRAKTTDRETLRNALGTTKNLELLCGIVSYNDRGDAVKKPTWVIHQSGVEAEYQ